MLQAQLKDIVKYAADRGIIVVPELLICRGMRKLVCGYPELASQPGPYHPIRGCSGRRSTRKLYSAGQFYCRYHC